MSNILSWYQHWFLRVVKWKVWLNELLTYINLNHKSNYLHTIPNFKQNKNDKTKK